MKVLRLDEIVKQCTESPAVIVEPPPAGSSFQADQGMPFWIVLVNPRRQPPVPKFHTGHSSEAEAAELAELLQKSADEQAQRESQARGSEWKPYRYFVVVRPEGGNL